MYICLYVLCIDLHLQRVHNINVTKCLSIKIMFSNMTMYNCTYTYVCMLAGMRECIYAGM